MGLLATAPWFIAKLGLALAAAILNRRRPYWYLDLFGKAPDLVDGVSVRQNFYKGRGRRRGFTNFLSEIQLPGAGVDFRPEAWVDRAMKSIGLTYEFESGDAEFDQKVYVRSDSESFNSYLKAHSDFREAVVKLIDFGAIKIEFEASRILLRFRDNYVGDSERLKAFAKFATLVAQLKHQVDFKDDPHTGKIARVRVAAWIIGVYAAVSVYEYGIARGEIFLNGSSFAKFAGLWAAVLLLALCVGMWAWFRDSSRTPRLFVDYSALLILAVVPFFMAVIADLDRYVDFAKPVIVDQLVTSVDRIETQGRRRNKVRYVGCFERAALAGRSGPAAEMILPRCLDLSRSDFESLQRGQGVRFHIGYGLFRFPWIKRIQPLEM